MKNAIHSEMVLESRRDANGSKPQPFASYSEEFRRAMKLVQEHKYFPKKYWTVQRHDVQRLTRELFQEQPLLPVKQVVLTILADLPDFLPSWNIHRVTGYITQTWKELSQAEEAPEPTDF